MTVLSISGTALWNKWYPSFLHATGGIRSESGGRQIIVEILFPCHQTAAMTVLHATIFVI